MYNKVKLKETDDNHCRMRMEERNVSMDIMAQVVLEYDNWDMQENGRIYFSKKYACDTIGVPVSCATSAGLSIARCVTVIIENKSKLGC